jgi:predicted P-loop ATPase
MIRKERFKKIQIQITMIIENYLNVKYAFHYNVLTNRTFIKEQNNTDYKLLNSYKINSIKRELNNSSISCSLSDIKSLLESDYVPQFNPFTDYFNNLPKWDQQTDYIQELIETVETTNQDDFAWAFKKWLVAMVACAIEDETTNQAILIFTGGQGIGKTTWMSKLIPTNLKEYFYSGTIQPNNKDNNLLLSERLIINLDELASFNKKQIELFKEMITKGVVSERRAYGHFTENYVRRASFVGSSNHNEILMDVTGNRRFLCFEAKAFTRDFHINMDLVYSQVMHLLKENFKYYFDLEDISRLEENNKMFKQSCEEEEWIDDLFELATNEESDIVYYNASEIIEHIKTRKKIFQKISPIEIGKIMTSKAFNRKKISGVWKYIIKLK